MRAFFEELRNVESIAVHEIRVDQLLVLCSLFESVLLTSKDLVYDCVSFIGTSRCGD